MAAVSLGQSLFRDLQGCLRRDAHVGTRGRAVVPKVGRAYSAGGNLNIGNHRMKSDMAIGKVGVCLSLLPWLTVALMFVLRPG